MERELYSLKNIIDFYENTENRKDLFAILNRDNRIGDHFLIGYGGDVIESNYNNYACELWNEVCQCITLGEVYFDNLYKKEWILLSDNEKEVILRELTDNENIQKDIDY